MALQSVTGSPHRRMQRSRTLPIMQLKKEMSSTAHNFGTANNFHLVRANTLYIHKQQTKGAKAQNRDWLPVPDQLPAGHPLLYRSMQRWYRDDESPSRFGSKQSVSPDTRNCSKASRIGSKATVMSRAASHAMTSPISMRDIASREQMRRRIETPQLPKPMQQRSVQAEKSQQGGEMLQAGNIVHALRNAVDAHESKGVSGTRKWLGQEGAMPSSIRQLDYWSAVEAFELYDFKRLGSLDKSAFYTMLRGLTRRKDYMDEKLSDQIFDEIDINRSGGIDKEEFLGWVFETNNFRLNHLREKLIDMTESDVKLIFRKIDKTGDGQLDQDEFWRFISSIGGITKEASCELHDFIDSDSSGQISFDEFLNWVHPDRELEILKSHGGHDWKADLVRLDGYKRPEKPLMETKPGKPLVIELWVGPDYKLMADRMKLMLSQMFSPEQVHWEFKTDGRLSGTCSRVMAKVGRGIEFWNKDTMVAYRDDPFLDSSGSTAREWLTAVLHKCLPDVERAANLQRLKQRRHAEKKAQSRQGSKQK